MIEILRQINATPGVTGSLVLTEEGAVLARLFPEGYDEDRLSAAAIVVADHDHGLAGEGGAPEIVEFRYAEARLILRRVARKILLVLCSKGINFQLLLMSLNVAVRKIEKAGEPA